MIKTEFSSALNKYGYGSCLSVRHSMIRNCVGVILYVKTTFKIEYSSRIVSCLIFSQVTLFCKTFFLFFINDKVHCALNKEVCMWNDVYGGYRGISILIGKLPPSSLSFLWFPCIFLTFSNACGLAWVPYWCDSEMKWFRVQINKCLSFC